MTDESNKAISDTNTGMLIELLKNVAVLTSEFKTFKVERNEDNVELKSTIKEVKEDVKKLQEDVNNLKSAPARDKAAKWEHLSAMILDGIIGACLLVILVKIGLK